MPSGDPNDQLLIDAIYEDRLAALDDPEAVAVSTAIGRRTADDVAEAVAQLTADGLQAEAVGDPLAPAQRHSAVLAVSDADSALVAARSLAQLGYRPWDAIEGAIGEVHRRFRNGLSLARATDVTTVLSLTWPAAGSEVTQRLPSALVPNAADHEWLASKLPLPKALWPVLFAARPVRLAAQRAGIAPAPGAALGPFLSTPTDLIEPLLDLAEVGPDDVVADLGCGDGRILMEAAKRGCRCIGVEREADLVAAARRRAEDEGVADRVTIIEGDALTARAQLSDVSAYFVFVPAEAAVDVVRTLLSTGGSGTRIVAHEQHRLPTPPPGAVSLPLLHGQGVTVAHRWTIT